ncbi:hypothetical protein EDB19DRAFT_1984360 [Suillus lakei]|nr:hypothetical protein EDB19DRAFT_1984360 [Suillus lakei]
MPSRLKHTLMVILTSQSSRFAMVTLTFGILKTFFDLSCPEVRILHILLSNNTYLFNQAQGSFNAYYELVGDWVFTYKGSKCALNPDGSLKDTKDIVFYNNPDDAVPIIPISAPSSAQPPTDTFSVLLQTGRKPVPLTADIDTDHGAGQSDEAEDEDVPAPEDEPKDEPEDLQDTIIRATLSKSECSADVRTIFTRDIMKLGRQHFS